MSHAIKSLEKRRRRRRHKRKSAVIPHNKRTKERRETGGAGPDNHQRCRVIFSPPPHFFEHTFPFFTTHMSYFSRSRMCHTDLLNQVTHRVILYGHFDCVFFYLSIYLFFYFFGQRKTRDISVSRRKNQMRFITYSALTAELTAMGA